MTYDDLLNIARRRALVLWRPSGIVERLRVVKRTKKHPKWLGETPLVVAGSPRAKGRTEHPIWPLRDAAEFRCVEVDAPGQSPS